METGRLLEMERNRLLMYTSCGWFFDEISALEPIQILKYAAMALQNLCDLGGGELEGEFARRLEAAPSNVTDFANGGEIYRTLKLRRAADAAVLPDRVFEVSEDAHSLGLELDLSAARPIISRTVGRALDALTERPTPERAASVVTLVLGAKRLGVGFGLWHTQNRFFALWRDHPRAREWLRPLAVTLGFALATEETW